MWQSARKEDQQRAGARLTLPVLSTVKSLSLGRPQLRGRKVLKLDDEVVCVLGEDISLIPALTRGTMRHLSSRQAEISHWQGQISESIAQVDREITAVELVKDGAEFWLQERQLYSQLMSDCVVLSQGLSTEVQTQDHVLAELKREEQLTNESRELLQMQMCMLLDNLSSLKNIRTQLLSDYKDKGEAIKFTTKCITHELSTLSSQHSAGQCKSNHVSYDKWLAHCSDLRLTADNLIKNSSTFRGNLRFTLANLKNAQERQHHSTDDSLRKKINKLSRMQEMMLWERQQVKDEISDLTKDIHKMMAQIRNCNSKLHQTTHRLDLLNQRPRYELCLDQPHISLMLEKHDLTKMAAGLNPILKRSQQDLELARRRLMVLEDKLVKHAHALEVEKKCQNLHQSFLPALDTTVVLANKPKLSRATGLSGSNAYLQ